MRGAVLAGYLVGKVRETRDLRLNIGMMLLDDVRDDVRKRFAVPVSGRLLSLLARLLGLLQVAKDLIYRKFCLIAGFIQFLAAAAAVIDSELFEDAGCAGNFDRQFTYGF